ncbi:hypothetical protein [Kitasatospora cheerisanensis]|uniref:hypothetical protein n=1 Tax=Kitasatospora cheerisanensis TaxID=81942 RepID=UPI001FCB9760|nr:hypothetical protein [Kitasatospora cheerisanensis]
MPPFEEIADSRPRIRRDVLYTQTPEGVLFHNAHGGFGVTAKDAYRFASLIVPHLNGRHTVAEISQGFGEHHRAMFTRLVATLYDRGFARDAGPAPTARHRSPPRPPRGSARRSSTSTTTSATPSSASTASARPGSPSSARTNSPAGPCSAWSATAAPPSASSPPSPNSPATPRSRPRPQPSPRPAAPPTSAP